MTVEGRIVYDTIHGKKTALYKYYIMFDIISYSKWVIQSTTLEEEYIAWITHAPYSGAKQYVLRAHLIYVFICKFFTRNKKFRDKIDCLLVHLAMLIIIKGPLESEKEWLVQQVIRSMS